MQEEENIKGFNWGAATLGLFWSIRYECFLKWLKAFGLINILPLILLIIFSFFWVQDGSGLEELFRLVFAIGAVIIQQLLSALILFIYAGIKGNKWASKIPDIETYKREQTTWTIASVGVLLAALLMITVTVTMHMIKAHENNIRYQAIQHAELKNKCTVMNSIVPPILKDMP